jgi:hypothetical protein
VDSKGKAVYLHLILRHSLSLRYELGTPKEAIESLLSCQRLADFNAWAETGWKKGTQQHYRCPWFSLLHWMVCICPSAPASRARPRSSIRRSSLKLVPATSLLLGTCLMDCVCLLRRSLADDGLQIPPPHHSRMRCVERHPFCHSLSRPTWSVVCTIFREHFPATSEFIINELEFRPS